MPLLALVLFAALTGGAQTAQRYLALADSLYFSNPDSSFVLCGCAQKEAVKTRNADLQAEVRLCRARYLLLKSRYEETSSELSQAISQFKTSGNKNNLARAYNSKAILLERLGDDEGKYNYENEAVRLYEEVGNIRGQVKILGNLSLSYTRDKRYREAADCLDRILAHIDQLKQTEIFFYYQDRGILHKSMGEFDRAMVHLENALDIAREQKMLDSEITVLTLLGQCETGEKKYAQAHGHLQQAVVLARNNHLDFELDEAYTALIDHYTAQEKYRQAFETLHAQQDLRAKTDQLQSIHKIRDQDRENDHTAELARQLANLKTERQKLVDEKNTLLSTWWIFAAGCLFLLVVLSWMVYVIYRLRRKISDQRSVLERLYKRDGSA